MDKKQNKELTGAGVLLIERYKGENVVVLFRENNGTYSDPGGHIDPGESPPHTAYRELREETCNLIHIKPKQLIDIALTTVVNGEYLIFTMFVENLSYDDYMENCSHIREKCHVCGLGEKATCKHWKETSHMIRIPIKNFFEGGENMTKTTDINGEEAILRNRIVSVFQASKDKIINMLKEKPYPLTRQIVKMSRTPCLVGTKTYTLFGYKTTINK